MSVGYKNPPKKAQFKKGQSGHPPGRPKQAVRLLPAEFLFRKVAFGEVAIEVNGVSVRMTRWEALVRQIHIMSHKKPSAARLLHQMRKKFPGDNSTDIKSILVLRDDEMNF